jgi:hypothetical protein
MKKILLGFILLLTFAGCDNAGQTTKNVGADGYQFGKKQYEKSQVTVDIVVYDSLNDLRLEAKKRRLVRPGEPNNIEAFAEIRPPNFDTCTIHIVDPAKYYSPEFVGHEFLHCVYGQWHSNNQERE